MKWHILLAVLMTVGCLTIGLWQTLSTIWPYWFTGQFSDVGVNLIWLIWGGFGVVALVMIRRRSPRSPAFTLLFEVLVLGELSRWRPDAPFDFLSTLFNKEKPTWLEQILGTFDLTFQRVSFFLIALVLAMVLGRAWLFSTQLRGFFGASMMSEEGASRPRTSGSRLAYIVGISALIYFVGPFIKAAVAEVVSGLLDQVGFDWYESVIDPRQYLFEVPPTNFLIVCGFLVWVFTERLQADANGVRLFLFRPKYSMFFAPWRKMRFFDVVTHDKCLPSIVVHYRSRFKIPFKLGVNARRYESGVAVTDAILENPASKVIRRRGWRSPDWTPLIGWIFITLGALMILAQEFYSEYLMRRFVESQDPAADLASVTAPIPLSLLYIASALFFGIGLGLFSAYQRGVARPALMALWVAASRFIYDPLLHWLVCIAIYAILMAIPAPLTPPPTPTFPSYATLDLAFTLVQWGPIFAGLGYILGVVFGRRPITLLRWPKPV